MQWLINEILRINAIAYPSQQIAALDKLVQDARLVNRSVLQDWVMALPLRYQGTLLTSMRCCDLAPKTPQGITEQFGCSTGECNAERGLHAWLRWTCLHPADEREVDIPGAWFRTQLPTFKPSQFGHYPLHWWTHLLHCYEIIGYCHPDKMIASEANGVYLRLVSSLHLNPETKEEMHARLTLDRIEANDVVS